MSYIATHCVSIKYTLELMSNCCNYYYATFQLKKWHDSPLIFRPLWSLDLDKYLFDVKPTWVLIQMLWQLFLVLGIFTPLSIYKGYRHWVLNGLHKPQNSCWLTLRNIFGYQLSSDYQRYYRMVQVKKTCTRVNPLCQTEFTLWQMQSMCKQRSSPKRPHKGSRNM